MSDMQEIIDVLLETGMTEAFQCAESTLANYAILGSAGNLIQHRIYKKKSHNYVHIYSIYIYFIYFF